MTHADFITLHQTGVINDTSTINVNITDNGDGTGTIVGIAIPIIALSVDGVSSLPTTDIEDVLQQAQTIFFEHLSTEFELTITQTERYVPTAPSSTPYYYYRVQDTYDNVNLAANQVFTGGTVSQIITQNNVSIYFTPYIDQRIFETSEYNATYGNYTVNRTSKIVMQSDRHESGVLPSNFDAIANNTATKAQVQDTLYTSTGLKNGRYHGSVSTSFNYGGVSPSQTVKAFQGQVFSANANPDLACGTGDSNRVLQELLHTGDSALPLFSSSSLGVELLGPISSQQQQAIIYTGTLLDTIDQGDILRFEDPDSTELVRVTQHNAFTKVVTIQRGYANTEASYLVPAQTNISKLDRDDVLKLENNTKAVLAHNVIIYVKESNSLIYTDDFGTIYSGSSCPTPTFLYLGSEDV